MNNSTTPVKIIVIDDEAAIRHSFADFLEDQNFEVLTAENGRIGLELIEREQPQIVLVDLRMPELDGLEVLKRSRKLAPDTATIVISGANQINDVVQALRYGAWDYLVKPIGDLSILQHAVEKALEKAELIHENRTYQNHLEERVQKRTLKLEQAFESLQKTEKQLRQAQKMEAIGTLAGGIAHDFNNILSGIFGYAQLIEINHNDPDKVKKNIQQVIKGAQRATDLVQQILMFSRQAEHKKHPLRLFLIVKEAIKFLRSSIPTTIEIQEKISSRATVLIDPTQAHQVVMNLCTNAYHAMRDSGGILSVELDEVEITENEHPVPNSCKPKQYLKLEIRDTGHGIDKKTLEKIFDPYFTTKRSGQGTGIGLAVVDGIVKKHDGFIKTYSEIGQGSTFQVFWPIIERNDSQSAKRKKTDLSRGTEQIMFVDDELTILESSREILENQGYKVTTFKNGLSALEAFTENPDLFDLVITDMTMPRMAGDELSAQILKLRKNMPVILCTGFSEIMSEEKAVSLGIKGFLLKPITLKNLCLKVREVLDSQGI